ncbi:EndoU domain-containing protein [Kordia sp. YSTF-M3]|uniref:EndoU domain-containing protein n=1 Tax=Kordia aestuariivivens TaxID=2759037 RepID=A0ABR7QED1_9FLAO|nr:EndoU domain-containing protein [Kordia aestuariivivens]MBC8756929.1 EndoU domain-containing protein [Kordia aestuariivivens]
MGRLIKKLLKYWEEKRKRKALLKKDGFKIVYKRDTSIVLGCFNVSTPPKNGRVDLEDYNGNIFKKNITAEDAPKYMKEYDDAASAKGITTKQHLDSLANAKKLRKSAYDDFVRTLSRQNFDELIEHIFNGHLRSTTIGRGRNRSRVPSTKGIHSEDLLDGIRNRVKPGSRRPPNPIDDEIYRAQVQMRDGNGNWIDKLNRGNNTITTTMFPKNWDKQRILEEVAFAFKNKIRDISKTVHYEGTSTNGMKIIFVIDNNGIVKTVYPI